MLKLSRLLVFQNYFNYVFVAPKRLKHKASTCVRVLSRAGFGPKGDKNFGFNSDLRRAFVLGAQKYN